MSHAAPSTPLLQVEGLSKTYDGAPAPALSGLDFAAEKGEFVAIVGPSGAGKSTFLRCINRLVEPSAGKVVFAGQEMTALAPAALRRARSEKGFVFQNHNLQGRLTVLQNVLSGLLGQRPEWRTTLGLWDKADVDTAHGLLADLGLAGHALKRADALSGGEQQRVSIARARIQDPRMILADEPVASLDPPTANAILADLGRVAREDGILVLVNLHFVDMALHHTERILGLRDGVKVWDRPAAETTEADFTAIYGRSLSTEDIAGE